MALFRDLRRFWDLSAHLAQPSPASHCLANVIYYTHPAHYNRRPADHRDAGTWFTVGMSRDAKREALLGNNFYLAFPLLDALDPGRITSISRLSRIHEHGAKHEFRGRVPERRTDR